MIISFPPAIGGGKRRDFNYFGTRPTFLTLSLRVFGERAHKCCGSEIFPSRFAG
ncbi:MAG: hypothetical protein LBR79_03845 [Oscillospiraceae bacterium]|nr:hypothetical protein [Oscillospiraceae bacterium]